MRRQTITWVMAILILGCVGIMPVYAADQPTGSSKGSKALDIPGNIPQTGDEILAKKDAELLRGKLVKVADELYTLETSPGRQVNIRTGKTTKFDANYKGIEGDWVEILVTPDQHIVTLKRSSPAYTVEGNVLKVEKDFFVVKDPAGKEIRLNTGSGTKIQGNYKVGDLIRAEFTPDGQALSIKPAKPPVGPEGA